MAAIGVESDDLTLGLVVTDGEEARLDAALGEQGRGIAELVRDPPVLLAPGATFGASKCWPAESYGELADRFAARGRSVILVGGPGEHLRLEAVRASMKSRPLVLDGVLDLGSLKALIRRAGLLVANDAGARHIAAAFDIPSVIFFGPTSVSKTADNLAAIEILETEHDCRPCYLRSCPIDHRCLRSITVADADDAVSRALAREGGKAQARPAFGATA
jgi:heptosyltransferase-2